MFVDVYNVGSKWESLLYPDSNLNLFGKLGIQHNDVIGSFFSAENVTVKIRMETVILPIFLFYASKHRKWRGNWNPKTLPERPFTSAGIFI